MAIKAAGFQWDDGNREKCGKHGVPLAVIEDLFHRSLAVFPDPAHSGAEARFKAIGWAEDGRGVFVIFTLRQQAGETLIRPISARYMHRKEVDHYESEVARTRQR